MHLNNLYFDNRDPPDLFIEENYSDDSDILVRVKQFLSFASRNGHDVADVSELVLVVTDNEGLEDYAHFFPFPSCHKAMNSTRANSFLTSHACSPSN